MNHRSCAPFLISLFVTTACQSTLGQALDENSEKCLTNDTLAQGILNIIRSEHFEEVVDMGPASTISKCPADIPGCEFKTQPVGLEKFPHLDFAVIAFQPECAQKVVYANTMFSRDFPNGIAAEFDAKTLGVTNVRIRKWDQVRADEGVWQEKEPYVTPKPGAWKTPFPEGETLNFPAPTAQFDFMPPYPASTFKILVALKTLASLEKRGNLQTELQTTFNHPEDQQNLTQQQYLESMLQWSGNGATRALVQQQHALGEIQQGKDIDADGYPDTPAFKNELNSFFASLGLNTLQMNRTRETGQWGKSDNYNLDAGSVHNLHMTAWDTARLLWLISDGIYTNSSESAQWFVPEIKGTVRRDLLSLEARRTFWNVMEDGLFHGVLSNTELCGIPGNGGRGIPAYMPEKWILNNAVRMPFAGYPFVNVADEFDPKDMHVSSDVRPCQANAEVRFPMKTGLTSSAGSQLGLAYGMKERGFQRKYIVSFMSNLGSRFTDKDRLRPGITSPCYQDGYCYTKKIPQVGKKLDDFLKKHLEKN